jgi:AAA15 family ATPase/GTPase
MGQQLIITTHSQALLEDLQEQLDTSADPANLAIYQLKKTKLGTRLQTYSASNRELADRVDLRGNSMERAHKAHV